jgi:hypothetical protein
LAPWAHKIYRDLDDLNLYPYVHNDPQDKTDPAGTDSCENSGSSCPPKSETEGSTAERVAQGANQTARGAAASSAAVAGTAVAGGIAASKAPIGRGATAVGVAVGGAQLAEKVAKVGDVATVVKAGAEIVQGDNKGAATTASWMGWKNVESYSQRSGMYFWNQLNVRARTSSRWSCWAK